MPIIEEANLRDCHESGWEFSDRSGTLPGGRIDLKVTDKTDSWVFECNRQSDGQYRISKKDWGPFVRPNRGAMLTLYSKEDGHDFHIIKLSDRSGTLSGDRIDLNVTDGTDSWASECDRQSDGKYRIRGKVWESFVKQNRGAMLTLSSKEDDNEDFHKIQLRRGKAWESFVKQNRGAMLTLSSKEDDNEDFHKIQLRRAWI